MEKHDSWCYASHDPLDITEEFRAEIKRLKTCSVIEMMCENPNVDSHVREWETRCLMAETEIKRLEDLILLAAPLLEDYEDDRKIKAEAEAIRERRKRG